jgi:diguanylate cyclase (GGDEF)-like protein/PAS domain S-box-containing protein
LLTYVPDGYAHLLDLAHEAILSVGENGCVRALNRAAERMCGRSRDETVGRPLAELVAPQCRAGVERTFARLGGEETRRLEFALVHRDGHDVRVEATVGAVNLNCGRVVTAYLRDVTARRREQHLQHMEHEVARALACSPTGRVAAPQVLGAIGTALGFGSGIFWRIEDRDGGLMRAAATWPDDARGTVLRRGEQLAGETWEQGAPVWRDGDGALGLPVTVDRRLVGVIELRGDGTSQPADDELEALETVAGMVGQFAERRNVEGQLAEETEALAAVARATRGLATATDAAAARLAICDAAKEAVDASVAFLAEPDPDGRGLLLRAVAGRGETPGPDAILAYDEPTAAVRAFVSGEPVFIPDVASYDSARSEDGRQAGVVSGFVHPVRRRGESLGVLGLAWETHMAELPPRLRKVVRLLADEAAIAISRADYVTDLVHAARTDALTGLPNRRAWEEDLGRALARSARTDAPVSVVLLDLDDFKALNDEHGHRAGDRLLKESVAAWRRVLRAGDEIARYGGDEFALLASDCAAERAAFVAERLRDAMTEGTASFGVAEWDGEESAETLVHRADEALYAAKSAGRNRVSVAD